jgi:dihydrofolate reductase
MITPFIITALTTDGFIARDTSHVALWTSKDDKRRFVELTKQAGVVVMGATTFKTLPRPLKDRLNIVYSTAGTFEGVENTKLDPISLIKSLEDRGFSRVAICGGASIYSMFLQAKVVKKLYLTVEPILFGKGISLFNNSLENINLALVSSTTTSGGTIFLEYDVTYL